ncbi:AAA family ATPase [Oceanirhabdus sp. W0125-5]|uniref:AAA family ATPase n=1 Tax=Oceanirhabdus sp. W0125-5 TaxID=2999116 RepID=UPI0022F30A66|nr:MoxR family ATPase [Oceanirhabdus sp. W0125-5]WBW97188.1 MoxR family ATPase [Oceanirhabdus sp. W0125-5]
MEIRRFQEFREKVNTNISKVIVGKEDKIDKIIVAFICSGHVLLEDVPGLGKTKLARSLAKTLSCSFNRIQFTPDILPADLTGIYYYNQKEQEFKFRKGPLLSQIVLADEINRATPRTQSALLECMEEHQITVEGNTIKLDKPFFVIATQNPVEQFGTFPLPEAQLDRFFIRLSMGYPTKEEEKNLLKRFMENDPLEELEAVVSLEDIKYVQENYTKVHLNEHIIQYIVNIINETRENLQIELGCSPRAALALMKASQAHAAVNGRDYVIPEDVKDMAVGVLSHRIILKNDIGIGMNAAEEIIQEILDSIEAPLEEVEK